MERARTSDADDDLAARVTLPQVADGGGEVAERVGPVDDGYHLAGLDEIGESGQIPCALCVATNVPLV
jgi:hypothetical protein